MRSLNTGPLGELYGLGNILVIEVTVYEYGIGENEQDAPIVLMYSDPTFPDQTDSFLAGGRTLVRTIKRSVAMPF